MEKFSGYQFNQGIKFSTTSNVAPDVTQQKGQNTAYMVLLQNELTWI